MLVVHVHRTSINSKPHGVRRRRASAWRDVVVFNPRFNSSVWGGVLAALLLSGCASSLYGWQSRTSSTPLAEPFHLDLLEERPVALLPAMTGPALRGNEIAISYYLEEILRKLAPKWQTVSPREFMTRINHQGLAEAYSRLMLDYEQSHMLNRDLLRKIAGTLGTRYVFQARLVAFSQIMTDRWKIPAFDVRMSQTRSSIMRLAVQLWDAESGALLWSSVAETTMQNEAVSQDPVYLEDIARATLGSMMADLIGGKTASKYTPVNTFLNNLIQEAMPKEKADNEAKDEPIKK